MLNRELKVCKTVSFSKSYIEINNFLVEDCPDQPSRYGDTKEVMNFKLEIDNPYRRCTGGYGRNINVFFLMAEAIWIFAGRRDVKFLEIFNSKIKEFSDNGEVFHAPYGWRMRNWGKKSEEDNPMVTGYDQIIGAINELSRDKETRRVAISNWNPNFDLGAKSLDLPCNSFLMYKIRANKLHQTIANRSNDLHFGLPTNVFQFSFIGECMANILGIEYGRQTHYSDSLHYYTANPIAKTLYDNQAMDLFAEKQEYIDLYDLAHERKMYFNFKNEITLDRLSELDDAFQYILMDLECYHAGAGFRFSPSEILRLREFSEYLFVTWSLLGVYIQYGKTEKKEEDKLSAINQILFICDEVGGFQNVDIVVLSLNFFAQRIKDKSKLPTILSEYIGTF